MYFRSINCAINVTINFVCLYTSNYLTKCVNLLEYQTLVNEYIYIFVITDTFTRITSTSKYINIRTDAFTRIATPSRNVSCLGQHCAMADAGTLSSGLATHDPDGKTTE